MKPLIKCISRVFLALVLCVSAPVAFASDDDLSYDIDKERIAQKIREKALAGDIEGAKEQAHQAEVNSGFIKAVKKASKRNAGPVELERVHEFLNNGANVNVQNKRGKTPLHFAAKKGAMDVVELLMNNANSRRP